MVNVHRLVCRLCKVVFISTDPYASAYDLKCFCGANLVEYKIDDHWKWERIPLSLKKLLEIS